MKKIYLLGGVYSIITLYNYHQDPLNSHIDKLIKIFYGEYRNYEKLIEIKKEKEEYIHPLFKLNTKDIIKPGMIIEEGPNSIFLSDIYGYQLKIYFDKDIKLDDLKHKKKYYILDSKNPNLLYCFEKYPNFYHLPLNYFKELSNRITPNQDLYIGHLIFEKDDIIYQISLNYPNNLINFFIKKREYQKLKMNFEYPPHPILDERIKYATDDPIEMNLYILDHLLKIKNKMV